MKVCFLIISVSLNYERFTKKLIESINKNIIFENKSIFLIGDNKNLISNDLFYEIKYIPPPLITLLRYYYISQVKELLKDFDIIYYIDSDTEVVSNIYMDEILPESYDQYVVVKHFYEDYCKTASIENNENSMAYIKSIDNYYQACFYGAFRDTFFKLVDYGERMVNIDLKNRIIAKWYDESYFNKYMMSKKLKVLSSDYAHPSGESCNSEVKIIHHNANTLI